MSTSINLVARTRRSLTALAVAAVLLVVAAFSARAQTTSAAKIAFDRGGNIWTMSPDGRNQTRVSDAFGISPALSPDGKRVAFLCGAEPLDVCTMNSDGTRLARLTSGGGQNTTPTWSPDGSQIAFHRRQVIRDEFGVAVGREGGIYVMTAGGSGLTKLNAPESFSPSWGVVPAEAEKPGQALASK